MSIRRIRKEDRSAVLDLIRETGLFTRDEEQVAQELIDIALNQPGQKDYEIEVVEGEAQTVAGYICYGPKPLTEGAYDLYWMAVHPRDQRKGYGRKLLQNMEQRVKERKGRLIMIETSSRDRYAPTRRFYEQNEYGEVGRVRDFYRPGDDLVLYGKYFHPEVT
ncbi:MAG: GNAT family N-acetyltransferase [Lentisphaerae bacterium]|nr:GNAT family N-acetyltransferase [Lentisphaerota bacterium]